MQYAKMIDLLQIAEEAGEIAAPIVNDELTLAFESWLFDLNLGEITEEEKHDLRMAFEKGRGNFSR